MNTLRTDFTPLAVVAQMLDRLDMSPKAADPLQYRLLAQRATQMLHDLSDRAETQEGLQSLLRNSPALTLLYENLHYGEAGLCRAPLAQAVEAEVATRNLLDRLGKMGKMGQVGRSAASREPGAPA